MRAWYGQVGRLRDKAFASSSDSLDDRQSHRQDTLSQTYLGIAQGLAPPRSALCLPDIFNLRSKY